MLGFLGISVIFCFDEIYECLTIPTRLFDKNSYNSQYQYSQILPSHIGKSLWRDLGQITASCTCNEIVWSMCPSEKRVFISTSQWRGSLAQSRVASGSSIDAAFLNLADYISWTIKRFDIPHTTVILNCAYFCQSQLRQRMELDSD